MGGSSRTECEGPHFTQKWVPIFTKPVWRIFSPGFMISEMNLWKFEHYFWKFRHYFSSTLMLKLMETLFVKLLCRTPETVRNFALKVLNLDRCGEKLKQVPFSQSWILSTAQSSFMQTQQLACVLHSKIKRYSLHSKIKVLNDSLSWIMSSVGPLHHKIWLPESRPNPELVKLQPQLNDRVIPFLLICLKKGQEPGLTAKEPRPTKEPRPK